MTFEERETALKDMRTASGEFYIRAVRCGVHAFIEFTGLMNEYIKMCDEAHKQGIDFSECNTHGSTELPAHQYHIDYLAEKLDCILGSRIEVRAVKPSAEVADFPISDFPKSTTRGAKNHGSQKTAVPGV